MKPKLRIYISVIILSLFSLTSFAQTDSIFWFAVPYATTGHDGTGANYHADLTITAKDTLFNTYIKISQPSSSSPLLPIYDTIYKRSATNPNPSFTKNINIPRDLLIAISNNFYDVGKSNSALLIEADSNRRMNVYYEYHRDRSNPDIFTLKGGNALGTEFWVPFQTLWSNKDDRNPAAMSQICIVATRNGTEVKITFQKDAHNYPTGGPYTIILQKGQTFMFVPKERVANRPNESGAAHLSGTHITSNLPIAVTTGDDSVVKDGAWDMIGDQLVPVENISGKSTIGYEYVVMRGELDNSHNGENVFVLATKDNTDVTWIRQDDGGSTNVNIPTAGMQTIINLPVGNDFVHIIANEPIVVFHVSGFGDEMGGAIVPTIDGCTGSKSVSFVRSKNQPYFLTLLTHEKGRDNFKLSTDNGPLTPIFSAAEFEYTGVGDLYVLQKGFNEQTGDLVRFPVNKTLRLVNDSSVFHLGTINGINVGGGCAYGYFSDYTFFDVQGRILQSGTQLLSSCYGNPIQLEVTEGHNSYEWTSTPASSITYLDDPTIFNPSGILPVGYGPNAHKFEVHVTGDCGLDTTLKGFQVEVFPLVDAKFNILPSAVGCAPYTIDIENVTKAANNFSWDFEDDRNYDSYTTDTLFQHIYQNNFIPYQDTVYKFRLYAENDTTGCSDQYIRYVRVHPEINAAFTANPAFGCNPLPVTFTDNSSGNLDTYIWKFGDGRESYVAGNVSNEYSHVNTANTVDFEMELRLTSPYFCRDTARATISVYSYLESEFTIDTAYGCSPLEVTFTNVSAGENELTLDYGDGTPLYVAASFASVNHTYKNTSTTVDTFVVVLTATNDSSCTKIWNDTIIVYPEFVADYDIDGPDNYEGCNTRDVVFTNTTTTSPDAASTFLWTFGDGSNSSTTAVNVPHTYTNNTSSDKAYVFNLHAESKYGCFDDTSRTITIYKAKANFTIDNDDGCAPLDVNIINTSEGSNIGTWLWDYGDGNTSGSSFLIPPHLHPYDHITTITQSYNLRLTVTHSTEAWCTTFKETTIDVFPKIAVSYTTIPAAFPICDSTDVIFNSTLTPNVAGTTYEWDFGDGTSSNSASPTHNYRNIASPGEVTYNVRVDAENPYGCTSFATGTVRVSPRVRAFFTLDKSSGCSPDTITVTPTSYLGISQYSWDFDGDMVTDASSVAAIFQEHTFPRNLSLTNTDDIYNVRLTVSNSNAACNKTFSRRDTVFAEAKAIYNPQGAAAIDCNPYEITFSNTSINNFANQWDFNDGTTSSAVGPTHTFVNNNPNSSRPYQVNLAVTTTNGCEHDTTATITVYPYVEANFDIDVSEGCSPLTVNITNNSKGGTYRWYWNYVDGSTPIDSTTTTTGVSFNHTYTNNSGNAQTVSLTCIALNIAGCSDTLTRSIIVQSAMNAQFVSLSVYENCAPFIVNFDNQTDPTSDAQYFTWDYGDGTTSLLFEPPHTFVNNTDADITRTVTLTAESAYGCPNSTTRDITIYRRVIADFELNTNEDCSPVEIEITNKSKGGTYQWSWDNPPLVNDLTTTDATINPILHTYTNTTQADVIRNLTVVASNGHSACNKTLSKVITVHSSVVADFTISDAANCNPLTSTFSPTVSADADKFYWYYSDGTAEISSAASAPVTHVFNNAGTSDKTFQIEMRAETVNGCKNSITKSVQVYSYLDANFAMESSSGCPPFSTTIENTSFGNAVNTYKWYVNGVEEFSSTGLLPFTHTYDNTDPSTLDYGILLHAENIHGCISEYTGTITVAENVQAIFSMTNDGCTPLPVTFTNSSLAPSGTLFYWDFKDGSTSTLQNPGIHTFYNPSRKDDKTFNVELSIISPSYCTDNTSAVVTAYHQPLSEFYLEKSTSCPPLITDMDMNESVGEDEWQWRFGDGNFNITDVNIENYTYQNTLGNAVQNYKLELWVGTNEGCKDSSHLTLSVYPEVIADFTYDAAGCSPFVSQFNNTSENANFYIWNFDDGNASNVKNPTNRFDNIWDIDRTYKVYLKASSEYNCWDTITHPVTAYVQPIAEFDVTPPVQKFPLNRAFIDNLTEPITGPFNYLWEFGNIDESTSTAVEPQYFDYDHWGEKVIKLSVTSQTSNCNDDITKTITILPPDVNAEFVTNINGGCLNDGLEVQFTASQSAYSENYEYEWDFGDGSDPDYSRVTSHVYESAGIYYVKLTATSTEGAGEDYEYKTIRVYSNPVANFEVSPKLSMLNIDLEARVEFFNLSECNDTSGCAYIWNFGDGGTAISRDVTHNYTELGKYDVSLYVTTANGCRDSLILLEEVEIIGAGEIAFPNAFTPNGDGLNDTFRPVSEGVIKYELLVYNRWGELIFTTKDLSAGWNGTVKGELAKPDVYVWKAMGNFTNGRSFELAGDVTLIR